MQSNYQQYQIDKSKERIDEILDAPAASNEPLTEIPSRTSLTFTNGFYVNCAALFADIRGSSTLSQQHTRPVLAKIYRAFISETIAVINADTRCSEIYVEGDCVVGIFNTPLKSDIDAVFDVAARIASLNNLLNRRFQRKGYTPITVGIGLSWGRALMIKAGAKGSGINEVVWMGDVLGDASRLCKKAARLDTRQILVSEGFYANLKPDNQQFLQRNYIHQFYEGNVVNIAMEDYIKTHC